MNEVHLKCLETDYAELLELLKKLEIVREVKGKVSVVGKGSWDYIGTIATPTGVVDSKGVESFNQPLNQGGVNWIHVNLKTEKSVKELMAEKAKTDVTVASKAGKIPAYFLLDGGAELRKAVSPHRVFL